MYVLTRHNPHSATDAATKAVIQTNGLVLRDEKNPYMAQRRAEDIQPPTGNDRFFEHQADILRRNEYVIALQCQKIGGVKARTAALLHKTADARARTSFYTVTLGSVNVAATARLQTGKAALKRILPLLDSRPDDVGLLLTIIQLYMQTRNPVPAVSLLEAFFTRLEAATTPRLR